MIHLTPKIGDQLITDYIKEVDDIRKDITYSPFDEMFSEFVTDLTGEKLPILDIIKNEELHLSEAPTLQDYTIENPFVVQELENANDLLNVFSAVVTGAYDGLNATANKYKKALGKPLYGILSDESAKLLSREIADKWRKRDFGKMLEKAKEQDKIGTELSNSSRGINLKFTPEQEEQLKKSIQSSFEIAVKKVQNSSSATGLDRVAGYEDTIKEIDKVFIQPIRQKSIDDIPSAILFYGPTGTGKTSIGVPLAQTTGSKFIQKSRVPLNSNAEALYNWLQSKAKDAEKLYADKQRHTIIQINEMGSFQNATEQDIEQFNSFISDCAKKHHLTIFFTTNKPLAINSTTLDKMKKIPMGPANASDIEAIIKLYLGTKNIENLNINELVNEFKKVQPNAYSNAQIQNIISNLPVNSTISQQQLLDRINNEQPAISEQSINDFNDEIKQLN